MKLSICCITYNHEKFIARAIDGFLIQKTNFDYEIVIGEDCSTDRTLEIIKSYQYEHSNRIKLLVNKANIGMMANFTKTMEVCTGKYIALCEGDDYWTDEYKLQKQVDFLECNPDYSICHHASKIFNEESQLFSGPDLNEVPTQYDIELLSKKNTIANLTVMYRNVFELPGWFSNLSNGDYPLHMLAATKGRIKYFPEEMAVYRRHKLSTTGSFTEIKGPLYLITSLEILYENLTNDKVVIKNLGLQILNLYITIFYHYHSLKEGLNSNIYFNKIRNLKHLFPEKEFDNKLLIQIYLYKIKDFIQLNQYDEIELVLNDFEDQTVKYLLQQYAKEVSLSNKLMKSKSYRLGNKLIDPVFQALGFLKGGEKKIP